MAGEVTHIEIGAPSAPQARVFFGTLFGWRFQSFGDGDQAIFETPSIRGGLHDGVQSGTLMSYFAVDDIEVAITRVRELGGLASDPSPEEPGFGRFANCSDDQGVPFGLHQTPQGPSDV